MFILLARMYAARRNSPSLTWELSTPQVTGACHAQCSIEGVRYCYAALTATAVRICIWNQRVLLSTEIADSSPANTGLGTIDEEDEAP